MLKRLLGGITSGPPTGLGIELQGTLQGVGPTLLQWDDSAQVLRLIVGSLHSPARTIELPADRQHVVYRAGALGDRLEIDGESLKIPFGRGKDVKDWIAAAQVRSTVGVSRWTIDRAAMALEFENPDSVTMSWIRAFLEPDEAVLALLATGDSTSIPSDWLRGEADASRWFLLTDRRTMLLAVSPFGEADTRALPSGPIELERTSSRTHRRVSIAGVQFRSTLLNQGRFEAIAELGPLDAATRLRRAASLWTRRATDASVSGLPAEQAGRLLELAKTLHPWTSDDASTLYVAGSVQEGDAWLVGVADSLAKLDARSVTDWAAAWTPPANHATAIARSMSERGADSGLIVSLLRTPLDWSSHGDRDGSHTVDLEVEFCEHLCRSGESQQAISIAASRLRQLPAIETADILSGSDSDLARHFWLRSTRVRLLEVLSSSEDLEQSATARLESCRAAPFDAERYRRAVESSGGKDETRLRCVLDLLAAAGLEHRPGGSTAVSDRTLSEPEIETLRHQLARRRGVLSSIYSAVASAEPPDASTLRDYAQRATSDRFPELFEALSDGARLLGIPTPAAYIASGQCRLAAVAHERPDRFVVVGGDHLAEGGPHRLAPAELRFLIGCQLADLRFGHARATSTQLRDGAISKAVSAASFLPVLGSLPVLGEAANKMAGLASFVETARSGSGAGAIARLPFGGKKQLLGGLLAGAAVIGAGKMAERSEEASAQRAELRGELGVRTEDLLAEHRVFQLTSDRFGLLLAGCPRAAIRAMFLTRSDLVDELAEANRRGLAACLLRTDGNGRLVHPYLAVRVAALLGFYLSEDYRTLATAAAP